MDQTIKNSLGERLDYSFAAGNASKRKEGWIVLLGHGVTGNKDRPVIADTAEALNQAGFDTLRFSFAGNGDSEGDFRDCTITKELDDLDAVLDATAANYPKVAYIGHSMGGAVGVLKAAADPRINALVSLAGMVDTKRFAETEFGEETPDEGLMWEEAACPLSTAFMNDLCLTIGTVAPQVAAVRVPWLLVHGTADDVVLPNDSEAVCHIQEEAVTMKWVDGADHSFGAPAHKKELAAIVADWFGSLA